MGAGVGARLRRLSRVPLDPHGERRLCDLALRVLRHPLRELAPQALRRRHAPAALGEPEAERVEEAGAVARLANDAAAPQPERHAAAQPAQPAARAPLGVRVRVALG